MAVWSKLLDLPGTVLDYLRSHPSPGGVPVSAWLAGGALLLLPLAWLVRRRRLPPGPWGMPFIGLMGSFPSQPLHLECMQMRQQYKSDVISYRQMGKLYVVIHGYKLIKEAFLSRGEDFAQRPFLPLRLGGWRDGIFVRQTDEEFRKNKKFAISTYRNYGTGKKTMEGRILTELDKVSEKLLSLKGAPLDPQWDIKKTLTRITTSIVYSSDYSLDDPEVDYILGMLRKHFEHNFTVDLMKASQLPSFLRNLFFSKAIKNSQNAVGTMLDFMKGKMKEHRETLDRNCPRDIVDQYLITKDGPDVDEDQLSATLVVFMVDAIDSLAAIITHGFLQIISNAQIQRKIQEELDRVAGKSGQPSLSHKQQTTYLTATTYEVFRSSHTIPMGAEHRPLMDTKLAGYDIPQNCIVFGNLYSVHTDPDIFPEPDMFKPEHFLDDGGNLTNTEYCIPFSIGRRMCIGEQLSKTEMYLFYASLFHKFSFTFPREQDKQDQREYISYVLQTPPSFEVCATPR